MPALARRLTAAAAAAVAVGGVSLASLPTANAATSCRVAWGPAQKAINLSSTVTGTPATAVRTGHHACYDRVAFELNGRTGATVAGYVGSSRGRAATTGSWWTSPTAGDLTWLDSAAASRGPDPGGGRGPYAVPPAGQPATARAKGSTWVAPAARRARPATVMVQRESTRSSTSRTAPGDSSRLSRTSGPAATRSHTPARR